VNGLRSALERKDERSQAAAYKSETQFGVHARSRVYHGGSPWGADAKRSCSPGLNRRDARTRPMNGSVSVKPFPSGVVILSRATAGGQLDCVLRKDELVVQSIRGGFEIDSGDS